MSTIVTRAGKGTALTHTELDANFTNLNTDKAGYVTGEGGAVTQGSASGKGTPVTLNKRCGQITMNNTSLASNALATFTLTNSTIAATDVIVVNHANNGVGTLGGYALTAHAAAGSATIGVRNVGPTAEAAAIVLNFAVIKAVAA